MNTIVKKLFFLFLLLLLQSCAWLGLGKEEKEIDKYLVAENMVTRGIDHFDAGRDSLAIEQWRQALTIIPDDAEVHNFIGLALYRQGETGKAIRYFSKALQLDSLYYQAANNLGYMYFLEKRYPEAEKSFLRALDVYGEYEAAQKNLQLVREIMGGSLDIRAFELSEQAAEKEDYSEQIPVYQRALNLDPGYAKAHNNLAVALYFEGRNDSASFHLEQALRIDPDYPEALHNMGYLYKIAGDYDPAIRFFIRALSLKPRYVIALQNLGETYYLAGDEVNARRVFLALKHLDEDNAYAGKYLNLIPANEKEN